MEEKTVEKQEEKNRGAGEKGMTFFKKLKIFLDLKLQKLKSGPVRCPFCGHVFENYGAMRAHLKVEHCTQ